MRASRSLALALALRGCDAPPPSPTTQPSEQDASATLSAAPSPPAPLPSASNAPTELDLVRRGDLAAMKRLELVQPSARSVEQALALTEGRAELTRAEAARLVGDLRADAKLRIDKSTLVYAAKLSLDQAAAPTLLAGLVEIGDPLLLDFVHDLGARADQSARLPLLAHDLLRVKAHREKTSKALAVLLELEDAELCWQVANQLPRAASSADSRAAPLLDRFKLEKGCGSSKRDDCWPCLREPANADSLQKAIDAVASRKFEPFWLAK